MQPTFLATVVVPAALAVVMLGLGLSLSLRDFKRVAVSPRPVGLGLSCQLLLLPALGAGIAVALDLPPPFALGLVILGSCPGGALSNAISHLVHADLALSVSLTAIASLVTPFTIPLVYGMAAWWWAGSHAALELPLAQTVAQLLAIAIAPIAAGMALRARFPRVAAAGEKPVRGLSIVLFGAVIFGVIASNREALGDGLRSLGGAALALNLGAVTLAVLASRALGLGRSATTTLGIEVGMQNAATATFVTASLLQDAAMSLPAVVYATIMVPLALGFGWLRRRPSRRGACPG